MQQSSPVGSTIRAINSDTRTTIIYSQDTTQTCLPLTDPLMIEEGKSVTTSETVCDQIQLPLVRSTYLVLACQRPMWLARCIALSIVDPSIVLSHKTADICPKTVTMRRVQHAHLINVDLWILRFSRNTHATITRGVAGYISHPLGHAILQNRNSSTQTCT